MHVAQARVFIGESLHVILDQVSDQQWSARTEESGWNCSNDKRPVIVTDNRSSDRGWFSHQWKRAPDEDGEAVVTVQPSVPPGKGRAVVISRFAHEVTENPGSTGTRVPEEHSRAPKKIGDRHHQQADDIPWNLADSVRTDRE